MKENNEKQERLMKLANEFLSKLEDLEQEFSYEYQDDDASSHKIYNMREDISARILRARAQLRN